MRERIYKPRPLASPYLRPPGISLCSGKKLGINPFARLREFAVLLGHQCSPFQVAFPLHVRPYQRPAGVQEYEQDRQPREADTLEKLLP